MLFLRTPGLYAGGSRHGRDPANQFPADRVDDRALGVVLRLRWAQLTAAAQAHIGTGGRGGVISCGPNSVEPFSRAASSRVRCHPAPCSKPAHWRNLRCELVRRTGARKKGHKSGADSPRGIDHGQSDGARVPPRWSGHRGRLVAPDESARSRKATLIWAVARRSRYVPLRFTSRDLRRASQEPHEKGTGGP